jgi:hypothetical protein
MQSKKSLISRSFFELVETRLLKLVMRKETSVVFVLAIWTIETLFRMPIVARRFHTFSLVLAWNFAAWNSRAGLGLLSIVVRDRRRSKVSLWSVSKKDVIIG